jgi:hypothetical protein
MEDTQGRSSEACAIARAGRCVVVSSKFQFVAKNKSELVGFVPSCTVKVVSRFIARRRFASFACLAMHRGGPHAPCYRDGSRQRVDSSQYAPTTDRNHHTPFARGINIHRDNHDCLHFLASKTNKRNTLNGHSAIAANASLRLDTIHDGC